MVEGERKRVGPQRGGLLREDVRGYCLIRIRFGLYTVIVYSPAFVPDRVTPKPLPPSFVLSKRQVPVNGVLGNLPGPDLSVREITENKGGLNGWMQH
jgi:hypothetical protein